MPNDDIGLVAMSNLAVLQVEDLVVKFGGVAAVDGVNLTLNRNELRCLIGPNGAGKSTLFKAIAGMVRPLSGRIWVKGNETTRLPPHLVARQGISVKTQVPSLLEGLTVYENLWIVARRKYRQHSCRKMIDPVMESVGISNDSTTIVNTMAHGRRQLVEFATALIAKPSIMLLDEPAAGLSDDEVEDFAKLLHTLPTQMSLLVVEHNMKFVRMIAQQISVLHKGRLLVSGEPDLVFNDTRVQEVYLGKEVTA